MVKLSEDFIFRLKNACDIINVVSSYVELKMSGKNRKCCCPFHSEKTPSFFVFYDTQSFYCFGCGVGGDIITFIEKIENLSYLDAVRFLANFAGISMEEEYSDDGLSKKREKILKVNRCAARFFHNNLYTKEGREGLLYILKNRKLKKETIVKFGIGYSLNSFNSLKDYLLEKGFSFDEKPIDVLHISGNLDAFVQERSMALAKAINSKEKSIITDLK